MKKTPAFLPLAVVCLGLLAAAPISRAQDQDTLVIYLILGQSNAQGHSAGVFRQSDYWDQELYGSDPVNNPGSFEALLEESPWATTKRAALVATGEYSFLASYEPDWVNSWLTARDDVFGVYFSGTVASLTEQEIFPDPWPLSESTRFTGAGPLSPGWGVNKTPNIPSEGQDVLRAVMGPELGMAHHLGEATNNPIFLFKSAVGGTSLAGGTPPWASPSQAARRSIPVGALYTNTVNEFNTFLAGLDADLADADARIVDFGNATRYTIGGVVWLQGWNDRNTPTNDYQLALEELMRDLRDEFEIPDLPAIIIESSDNTSNLNPARTAAVATLNGEQPGSAVFVETSGLKATLTEGGETSHFDNEPEAYAELGWRAGQAIVDNGYFGDVEASGMDKKDGPFWMGPVGVEVNSAATANWVTVLNVEAGSPADGLIQVNDEIFSANGVAITTGVGVSGGYDPRVVLGNAITGAEASDGEIDFSLRRGGSVINVVVDLPTLPAYASTWPTTCPKSDAIIAAVAPHSIAKMQEGFGGGAKALHALFLLSTGEQAHLDEVATAIQAWAPTFTQADDHTWYNGWLAMALGEYYLRTGDASVLPPLQLIVDDAFEREAHGGWGHQDYATSGYVRGGLVNAAGGGLFIGLTLARECGVTMAAADWEKTLKYFYRYAGYGGVPYGDHRPAGGGGNNGKTGALGVGLSLLNDPYASGAELIALEEAFAFHSFEGGHTGNFTNVLYRMLATPLVPDTMWDRYQNHMDELRFYLELCRRPNGEFRLLPVGDNERYVGADHYGIAAALAYTAGRKHLRMTGGAPGVHSTIVNQPEVYPKDSDFMETTHAEGQLDSELVQNWVEMQTLLNAEDPLADVSYIAKHFRSRYPLVRGAAARAMAEHGDAASAAIETALQSSDARVRHAGLTALTLPSTFFFSQGGTDYSQGTYDTTMLPHVLTILNSATDVWELDAALCAMRRMSRSIMVTHHSLLDDFLTHESWWVRAMAFDALTHLQGDESAATLTTMGTMLPQLMDCLVRETHAAPIRFYDERLRDQFLPAVHPHLSASDREAAVALMGDYAQGGIYAKEYAYVVRANENPMLFTDWHLFSVLASFEPDELLLIADALNQHFAQIGHPVLTREANLGSLDYIFGGGGILALIEELSPAQRQPLIPGLKALLAGSLTLANDPVFDEPIARLEALVATHEATYGASGLTPARNIDYSTPAVGEVIPTPYDLRLMMHWDLEEGSGVSLLNHGLLGPAADGTLTDALAWTGAGLGAGSTNSIDAATGQGESTVVDDVYFGDETYTVSAWVRLDPGLPDADGEYVAVSSGTDEGWNFGVRRRQVNGQWRNVVTFNHREATTIDGVDDSLGQPDLLLNEGQDYFIAFVRDATLGDAEKGNTLLYLYDPAVGSLTANDGNHCQIVTDISFGELRAGVGTDNAEVVDPATTFPGLIDDPQVWNAALDFGEIFNLGAAGSLIATPEVPVVINQPATMIGSVSATLNGAVTDAPSGGPDIVIFYGISDGGTDPTAWGDSVTLGSQTSAFSASVTGLADDALHYFRARATAPGGTVWAPSSQTFTTPFLPDPPVVRTDPPQGVADIFASLYGEVTATGGEYPFTKFFLGTVDQGETTAGWDQEIDLGPRSGFLEFGVTGLAPNTTYFYRAHVSHPGGTDFGEVETFTTADAVDGAVIPSVQDGEWMDAEMWHGALIPVAGDNNTWHLFHTAYSMPDVMSFPGRTLVIGSGGGLSKPISTSGNWGIDNLVVETGGTTLLGSANQENAFSGSHIALEDGAVITARGHRTSYCFDEWSAPIGARIAVEHYNGKPLVFKDGPGAGFTDMKGFFGTFVLTKHAGSSSVATLEIHFPIPDPGTAYGSAVSMEIRDLDAVTSGAYLRKTTYGLRDGLTHTFLTFDVHRERLTVDNDGDGKYDPGDVLSVRDISIPPGSYTYPDLKALDADLEDVFLDEGDNSGRIVVQAQGLPSGPPTIENRMADGFGRESANLKGEVTVTGGHPPAVTIYYGTSDGGTDPNAWDSFVRIGTQAGNYSEPVSGLIPGTTYYYRAHAINAAGEDWTDDISSFTLPPLPYDNMFRTVQAGGWMDSATWENGLLPTGDDTNGWLVEHPIVKGDGFGVNDTFPGEALIIAAGVSGFQGLSDPAYNGDYYLNDLVLEREAKLMAGSSNRSHTFWGNTLTLEDGAILNHDGRDVELRFDRWVADPGATIIAEAGNRHLILQEGPGGVPDMSGFRGTLEVRSWQATGSDLQIRFDIPAPATAMKLRIVDSDPELDDLILTTGYMIRDGLNQSFITVDAHRVRILGGDGDTRFEFGETLDVRDISIPPGVYTHAALVAYDSDLADVFYDQGAGTGTITVVGPPVVDRYVDWAGRFTGLTNTDPGFDFDRDGLPTGIEWVVGGDPTVNDGAGMAPTIDNSDPDDFLFVFARSDEAEADPNTAIAVDYGSDLTTWRNTIDHGTADGVTTTVEDDGFDTGFDKVTVAIPRSLEQDGALFARLKVTIAIP